MGARGEGRLALEGGREVAILFTNRALAEAETACGKSVVSITRTFQDEDVPVGMLAHLLACGVKAARRDAGEKGEFSLDEAYELLDEVGYVAALVAVAGAIADALVWKRGEVEGENPPAEGLSQGPRRTGQKPRGTGSTS